MWHDGKGKKRNIPKYKEDARAVLPGAPQKLFFLLYTFKGNSLQEQIGFTFQISQGKVSHLVNMLSPLLKKSLAKLDCLAADKQSKFLKK